MMKLNLLVLHIIVYMIVISVCQSKLNIIKSLPGYQGNLPFTLETGYIGVGELEEIQSFYYFVASERNPRKDPLMLWITGGPGCSALTGLAFEIGPLKFNYSASGFHSNIPQFQQNPYSWTKVASVIFLDSPVGTGFSYATTSQAYYSNDNLQAANIYDFLRKWLRKHPQYMNNPLYISGDSYGGRSVPMAVQEIINGNKIGNMPKLNLKGFVIGNPSTNEDVESNMRVKYQHRVSIISDELYKFAKQSCNGEYVNVDSNNTECERSLQDISELTGRLKMSHVLEPQCMRTSPKPIKRLSRRRYQRETATSLRLRGQLMKQWCRDQSYLLAATWANDERVRKTLRIREGSVGVWSRCNNSIAYTKNVPSGYGYHQNFTKEVINALIYSGDQDMAATYVDTIGWITRLNFSIDENWKPWLADSQVAGFVTEYSNQSYHLTYTTIKGGGHTAPEYRPRECFAMIKRWLSLHHL